MATLSDLRERIKRDTQNVGSTEYDGEIDDAIRSALRQLRRKRFWFLRKLGTLTATVDQNYIALPSDFSAPDNIEYSNGNSWYGRLNTPFLTYDELSEGYWGMVTIASGFPEAFAILNGRLYLSRPAGTPYSVRITYFAQDATLPSDDEDTSIWFDDGFDVVRSLAIMIFKRDSQAYQATQADEDLYQFYYSSLCQQGQTMEDI